MSETTVPITEKKFNLMDDLSKLSNKVEFKKYSLPKKAFLVWCVYFVIENLTKDLSLNKKDIIENVIELPKKVWSNFWEAPTGKKALLAFATWYVVKNLFTTEEKAAV